MPRRALGDGTVESHHAINWSGTGTSPTITPLGFGPKVFPLPKIKAAIGACGAAAVGMAWARLLASLPLDDVLDIDIASLIPMVEQASALASLPATAIFIVGWSERAGCTVGNILSSDDGFQPRSFTGSLYSIIPYAGAPDYQELLAANALAEAGRSIEGYHVAIAWNVDQGRLAGHMDSRLHVGGELTTITIDRHSVKSKTPSYTFQRYAELCRSVPVAMVSQPHQFLGPLGVRAVPGAWA